MAKAYVLTEADVKVLKEIVEEYRTRDRGGPPTPEEQNEQRSAGAYIAYPDDAGGLPAATDDAPGSGLCTIYKLSGAEPPTVVEAPFKKTVYNLQETAITPRYFLVHRLKSGKWVAEGGSGGTGTVGIFLTEDHPGRGVEFDVYVGTWDANEHDWTYSGTATYKAIDWRYGVPYPTQGAQGLAEWRSSTQYGSILEVTSLDCESPGTGTAS